MRAKSNLTPTKAPLDPCKCKLMLRVQSTGGREGPRSTFSERIATIYL
jgi:hypothetical protein